MSVLPICRAFFAFILLIVGLASCQDRSHTRQPDKSAADSVPLMIARGLQSQNIKQDSLLVVSKKLQALYTSTGDSRALVYSELFESDFYWKSAEHTRAMELAVKSLADAEKYKVSGALPEIYSAIANIHKENRNYKMAFAAADKALAVAEQMADTANIISVLGLKAMFIRSYSLSKRKPLANDSSIQLQFAALKMAEANPRYESIRTRFYDNIAQYYKDHHNYDLAIAYGNKAVPIAFKYNQKRSLTYAYCWLGEAWYRKGDKVRGLNFLNDAIRIATELKQPFRVMEIYDSIYDCYLSSGDFKEANTYGFKYRVLRDSLQVVTSEKQIGELQIKYETVKKDKAIAFKSKQLYWILSGTVLFILLGIILLFQSRVIYRNNKRIEATNARLNKALEKIAYIQSHELRKPVASIIGLINVIKMDGYKYDTEVLRMLEIAAEDLDDKIKDINKHTQVPL